MVHHYISSDHRYEGGPRWTNLALAISLIRSFTSGSEKLGFMGGKVRSPQTDNRISSFQQQRQEFKFSGSDRSGANRGCEPRGTRSSVLHNIHSKTHVTPRDDAMNKIEASGTAQAHYARASLMFAPGADIIGTNLRRRVDRLYHHTKRDGERLAKWGRSRPRSRRYGNPLTWTDKDTSKVQSAGRSRSMVWTPEKVFSNVPLS